MSRSWLLELRGGLTALAAFLALTAGAGLVHRHNPIALILDDMHVHAAIALFLVAIVLLLVRAYLRGLVFLAVGAAILVMTAISLAPLSQMPVGGKADLKVISFNLNEQNGNNGERIAAFLSASGADIVFIQESAPIVPFLAELAAAYPYQAGCRADRTQCGNVLVLSKYPLGQATLFLPGVASAHEAIRTDIAIGGKTVHLVGVHLLRPAYGSLQVNEMQNLGRVLAGINGPLILAGDFNTAAWVGSLAEMLKTGDMQRAAFEPGTWPAMLGDLGVPIDHVFVRAPAHFTEQNALPDSFGSDHRGLMAGIVLGDAP